MKVFYSDHFPVPVPAGHSFPSGKHRLLRERVIASGLIRPEGLSPAAPATDELILRVHTREYLDKLTQGKLSDKEIRRIGLPWSPQLVECGRRSSGATVAACRAALQEGLAANLGGGTHHAFPDHGQGYCVFNDVAIAIRAMQAEGRAGRAVVLDCDVHQGNGTAAIFLSDPLVFTFSIHSEKNFPYHKEPSNLDIGLPDGCGDGPFLEAVDKGVQHSLGQAQVDLVIYIAGADPYVDDRLGRLAISMTGLEQRDRLVLQHCQRAGLPIAITLGGGYGKRIEETVEIHLRTLCIAQELS